ncbi:hypothetical protein [Ruegeria hyattellae]|uniref:hypothetical protein n=1 Tax=Ruegeria hyattellae TaxID=3233337 RepID=UPI00355AD055
MAEQMQRSGQAHVELELWTGETAPQRTSKWRRPGQVVPNYEFFQQDAPFLPIWD